VEPGRWPQRGPGPPRTQQPRPGARKGTEDKPYAVEALGDRIEYITSRDGKVHSLVYRCFDTRAEADQYGRTLHAGCIHYRVTEYDPEVD
jgi:hypothetical protein